MRVEWTLPSESDLEEIKDYFFRKFSLNPNPHISRLIEATRKLALHPKIGRMVPEFHDENIRELIEGQFRIIYQKTDEMIFILAVLHSRQDFHRVRLHQLS